MKTRALAFLAFLPLAAGCASQKVIDDYEAEISALREERTALKAENMGLQSQLDQTQMALANASSELDQARVQEASVQTLPELGGGLEVGMRGSDVVITVPSSITFASGKATLSKQGQAPLRKVAKVLMEDYPNAQYWIEGYTDSDKIKKSGFKSNRDLSMQRAMSVHRFLVEECGVPDEACVVAGHGEYSPVADNSTKAGKAKNRRVEIVVHQ